MMVYDTRDETQQTNVTQNAMIIRHHALQDAIIQIKLTMFRCPVD